jgi:four helix bundle protein
MKIDRFEEILAWQKSRLMTSKIYSVFKELHDFGFKDQICRASISVMNNIAEGFERKSDKEFMQFLFISKGSCGEVRSMIYLAKDLNYIQDLEYTGLMNYSTEISKMLSGLIKTLK